MKLSVSCPSCGKHFRNIKPEMAGKKARCGCGMVVRLDTLSGQQSADNRPSRKRKRPFRQIVDQGGDEVLGDQLLGSNFSGHDSPRPSTRPKPVAKTGSSQHPAAPGHRVPEVPITVAISPSASEQSSIPTTFNQTYGDLDDILASAGDASPLVARQPDEPPTQVRSHIQGVSQATRLKSTPRQAFSLFGFLAAVGSALLAFWLGIFIVMSRFQHVDWIFLGGFSTQLRSAFTATFGESEVPPSSQLLFVVIGWLVWCLAIFMIVAAVGQFVNAFVNLLTSREPVGWADGVTAAVSISIVFLLVAVVFAQTSLASQEKASLDAYERPFVEQGEHLANVALLRAEVETRDRSFTIAILSISSIPMTIFAMSMFRLFTKTGYKT